MFCEHCGVQIPNDSRFCEHCGKPVIPPVFQSPKTPAPAPSASRGIFGLFSKPAKGNASPDYSRIVLWIQGRYGSRFAPGMDASRVRAELEAIMRSEQARGIPAQALKGFRSFIDRQHYETLIQIRR